MKEYWKWGGHIIGHHFREVAVLLFFYLLAKQILLEQREPFSHMVRPASLVAYLKGWLLDKGCS